MVSSPSKPDSFSSSGQVGRFWGGLYKNTFSRSSAPQPRSPRLPVSWSRTAGASLKKRGASGAFSIEKIRHPAPAALRRLRERDRVAPSTLLWTVHDRIHQELSREPCPEYRIRPLTRSSPPSSVHPGRLTNRSWEQREPR